MRLSLFLMRRFMGRGAGLFNLSTILCVVGLTIGVGSLTAAMAVVSGYEESLRKAVIDLTGHVMINRYGIWKKEVGFDAVLNAAPEVSAWTPFAFSEGALVHGGKMTGVFIEGVAPESVASVLNLEGRKISGSVLPGANGAALEMVLGRSLAQKHGLKVGDLFRLALPTELESRSRRPKLKTARVIGVVDMGRHDYNSRYMITHIKNAQAMSQMGEAVSGIRLKVADHEEALRVTERLRVKLGSDYRVRSWRDMNANLFSAIQVEKPVLFFVLLVMVIAASFNVATTVFVSVFRRYRDISILKTMGASRWTILAMFSWQGLMVGAVGSILGLGLGMVLADVFIWAQTAFGILPVEVYKIEMVSVSWRLMDLVAVVAASLGVALLAALGPAQKGATLPPVQGLRYE